MRRSLFLAVLLFGLIAGLVPAAATAAPDDDKEDSRVVVAPMDSGINPYHAAFQVEESAVTQAVLDDFNITSDRVITLGSSYDADKARVWDTLQTETDYHFTGTNIIARSYSPSGNRVIIPGESDTHGVGVSGSVAAANPEAIIYFIQGGFLDDGEPWTFNHPQVDIVTMSYGLPVGAMALGRVGAYEGVVEQGKLAFGAATNDPQVALFDGTAGPWYEIAIAGYTEEQGRAETRETLSGNAIDFVADFTQTVPYCATCITETRSVSGTSFATPRSAGIMSKIILEARREAGHLGGISDDGLMVDAGGVRLSNWDFRRSLEEAAYIPDSFGSIGRNLGVNPVAPYVQVGWGALSTNSDNDVVPFALDHVMDREEDVKDANTCDYMTGYMYSRYALWDSNPDFVGGGSGSFGETNILGGSPYIAC